MDPEFFIPRIRRLGSTQRAELDFAVTGLGGLRFLKILAENHKDLRIYKQDSNSVESTLQRGRWDNRESRYIRVSGLQSATDAELAALCPHIDNIQPSTLHEATDLRDDKVERRETVAKKIENDVLSDNFKDWLNDRGVAFECVVRDLHTNDPMVDFVITNLGTNDSFTVTVDGWSGQLMVNDVTTRGPTYQRPAQVQELIKNQLVPNETLEIPDMMVD